MWTATHHQGEHINAYNNFNTILPPSYCSISFIKLFKRSKRPSLFDIISQQPQVSAGSIRNGPPIFITEVPRLY